jgi:FkbM family methyltransferase
MGVFQLAKRMVPANVRSLMRDRLARLVARMLSQRGISISYDLRNLLPIREVATIIDVGANRGDRARLFTMEYPHAVVHCVEPVPELAAVLRKRFRNTRCQVHQVAMAAASGSASMTLQETCGLFTLKNSSANQKDALCEPALQVVTCSLHDFCHRHGIACVDYLKVDAGGADLEVLRGAAVLFERSLISVVEVEAGINPDAKIFSSLQSMKTYMESHHYRAFGFYEQVSEWPTHQPQLRRVNCVFISPQLQNRVL